MLIGQVFEIAGTNFIMPNVQQIEWIIYMGLVATIGHLLIVWAATNAPASVLAPFQYTEIISSVILGYLVFNDLPAKSTVLGVSIIVACGNNHNSLSCFNLADVFFVMLALSDKPQG